MNELTAETTDERRPLISLGLELGGWSSVQSLSNFLQISCHKNYCFAFQRLRRAELKQLSRDLPHSLQKRFNHSRLTDIAIQTMAVGVPPRRLLGGVVVTSVSSRRRSRSVCVSCPLSSQSPPHSIPSLLGGRIPSNIQTKGYLWSPFVTLLPLREKKKISKGFLFFMKCISSKNKGNTAIVLTLQ
ncbi:hypothetical protein J6590_044302 [Homalodisca vitripennis]|nr:hypothetical protein J6590_044302 [Homalodisca vitripennis]